jgi:glycosyltransferase involved in cell wall biosynthesis
LVKEADALAGEGCTVIVIYQYWNEWASELDNELLHKKAWRAILVGGSPKENSFIYNISRGIYKITRLLSSRCTFRFNLAETAISRSSFFLYLEAKKHKADLYIGHNLGALPATVWVAKYHQKPCGFDAEDFHRNETSDDPKNEDVRLKTYIENNYFPHLNYLTTSSPLISQEYSKIFPTLLPKTILNAFPVFQGKQSTSFDENRSLKLFWFSQSIGLNRGLEDIFKALKILENFNIQLHLLGDLPAQVSDDFEILIKDLSFSRTPKIVYHKPIIANRLIEFASDYDIGLALEPGFSKNNDIALSNKIFTYLNAGLAIVATETSAQKMFADQNPDFCLSYPVGDEKKMSILLRSLIEDPNKLNILKFEAHKKSELEYNWKIESAKFLSLIEKIVHRQIPDAELTGFKRP